MYFLGKIIGLFLMWTIVKPMRLIYGSKPLTIINGENFRLLEGKSFFIVSNHIKPRNWFLKMISMPYDAFIARGAMLQFGIHGTAIASYDSGKRTKASKELSGSAKRKERLIKGIVESLDLIPLNRNESDVDTLRQLKHRLQKGNLGIGIFPEGTYFRGYRKSRKLHGGVAILAKRYELPILPIYIHAYNLNQPISLRIGKPIWNPKDSATVCLEIRNSWNQLNQNLKLATDIEMDSIEVREAVYS